MIIIICSSKNAICACVALPGHSANATYAFRRPPDEFPRATDVELLLDALANQSCAASGKPPSSVIPVSRMDLLSSLVSILLTLLVGDVQCSYRKCDNVCDEYLISLL